MIGIIFGIAMTCATALGINYFKNQLFSSFPLALFSTTNDLSVPIQCPPPIPWFSVVCVAVSCDVIVRLAWKGIKEWWRSKFSTQQNKELKQLTASITALLASPTPARKLVEDDPDSSVDLLETFSKDQSSI